MTGFIAREVRKVIPGAVKERADGYLELNVDPIHWATVNAVKELAGEKGSELAALKLALYGKLSDLSFCSHSLR